LITSNIVETKAPNNLETHTLSPARPKIVT
jgi:hypothetical protein